MAEISRRLFLLRGSAGAAGVGLIATSPGLISGITSFAPAEEDESNASGEAVAMTESVVAHVRDISSGEIRLFVGDREVVYHDTKLASQIVRATK